MAAPWEKYQKSSAEEPWTKYREAQPPVKVGTGEDVGRGVAAGLFRGGLDLLGAIVNPAGSMIQGPGMENTIEDITGREFYDPETQLGKGAEFVSRAVPFGAAGGGAGGARQLAVNAFRYGAVPATAAYGAGEAAKGTKWEIPASITAGVVAGGGPAVLSRLRSVKPLTPPTATELLEVGGKEYDALRQLDVRYHPNAVVSTAENLRYKLFDDGIGPKDAPRTYDILDELATAPVPNPGETAYISLSNLESARRRLRTAGKNIQNPADKAASSIVRDAFDDFVEQADPATVISGPADVAAQLNRNARANYAAGKRSQKLNQIEESSELRAASTYSGQNLENKLRQRAADVVDPLKPKNREGLSPNELALIESVARAKKPGAWGPSLRNVLRGAGNVMGGGGGLAAQTGGLLTTGLVTSAAGPWIGIPAGMAVPAIGYGLKRAATKLTQNAFHRADEAVRSRAPYSERLRQQTVPVKTLPPEARAAMGQAGIVEALADRQIPGSAPIVDPRLLPVIRALMPPQ